MDIFAYPKEIIATGIGTIPAGALEISVKNLGNQSGIVNGIEIEAGEPWTYGFIGKPYAPIDYDATGTILRVRYTI